MTLPFLSYGGSSVVAIALGMGLLFMVAVLVGGRGLFGLMGARGGALRAAMIYSNLVFGGAVLVWVLGYTCEPRPYPSGSPGDK